MPECDNANPRHRLTEMYEPLWFHIGGDEGAISNVTTNPEMRSRLQQHYMLLSPDLRGLISQSLLLGRFNDEKECYEFTQTDLEKVLELSRKIKPLIKRDMAAIEEEIERLKGT